MIMHNLLKYFLSCCLLLLLYSSTVLADQQQDPALTQAMLNQYSLISPQILAGRHYWVEIALKSDMSLGEAGFETGIGYRFNYFGTDLRLAFGKTTYGKIRSLAAHNLNTDTTQNAEIFLSRNKSDSWNYWSLEPGLSVASRLLSGQLSELTERARVGFIYGKYTDNVYQIPFTSYILSVESSIIYQRPDTPWSLCGSLNWNTGMLVRYYDEPNKQSYGLPASWLGSSLALQYAF